MLIQYNNNLSWGSYRMNHGFYTPEPVMGNYLLSPKKRAFQNLNQQAFVQPISRSLQFTSRAATLAFVTPVQSVVEPIFLKENWKQRERARIDAALTKYTFIQLACTSLKLIVALVALGICLISGSAAKVLLDKSDKFIKNLDGKMAKFEALKKEGLINSQTKEEYEAYKKWIGDIDPILCLKD